MNGVRSLRMVIDGLLSNVSLVGNAVRGVLENEPGPSQDAALVELAVCEAVNNSIIHAYGRTDGAGANPGEVVEVIMELSEDRLTVTVADHGRLFKDFPAVLPRATEVDDLLQAPLGGWGLRILAEVMETVSYRTQGRRNELKMSRPWR
jgi:serine/threonine-protein kinase RsbW